MPDPITDLLELGLCCPRCRGDLVPDVHHGEGTVRCATCAADYPVLLGIPDLRLFADPYLDIDLDRAKGRRLADWAAGRTWEDMVAHYYDISRDTVPAAQARRFSAGLHAARPRATVALDAWAVVDGGPPPSRLLEIGCGTAPLLAAAGSRVGTLVGVDIAFRWLVVAQRRLRDAGVHAHLVCACAEALPFRAARFDVVASEGTLESVRDQATAMTEAFRVLQATGRIWTSTANRLSLAPDPFGIPGGGMLPQAVVTWWARRQGALPPRRRLLSVFALAALLRRAGFEWRRVAVPPLAQAQLHGRGAMLRRAGVLYEWARARAPLRRLLLLSGPTLLAVARKPAAPD